jgi:hypothetical protein
MAALLVGQGEMDLALGVYREGAGKLRRVGNEDSEHAA